MKTIIESLEEAYKKLQKSTDTEASVARRDLYLILEDLKGNAESGVKLNFFYNEKGDYTITLHEEPVAIAFTEADALKIVNHVRSLTLRIDVLSKIKQFSLT